MGWKNIKTEYQIKHIVQVTDKGICIGSGYIHDIIVIGLDGCVRKRYDERGNDDLSRYQREFDADPAKLKRLLSEPDSFDKAVTVYTYRDGAVLEKLCEEPGWPNVTHEGEVMYENTFSTDKSYIVGKAKSNATCGIEWAERSIAETRAELADRIARLDRFKSHLAQLEAEYPQ